MENGLENEAAFTKNQPIYFSSNASKLSTTVGSHFEKAEILNRWKSEMGKPLTTGAAGASGRVPIGVADRTEEQRDEVSTPVSAVRYGVPE